VHGSIVALLPAVSTPRVIAAAFASHCGQSTSAARRKSAAKVSGHGGKKLHE
jgi:hypothetical protein